MNLFRIAPVLLTILLLHSCRTENEHQLVFNPQQLTDFISTHSLTKTNKADINTFYEKRNYAAAWLDRRGLNKHGKNFLDRLQHEQKMGSYQPPAELVGPLSNLHELADKRRVRFKEGDTATATMDFMMSYAFMDFAQRNWNGTNDEYLKKSKWLIKRKDIDLPRLLDSLLAQDNDVMSTYEPVYFQYGLLKKQLFKYRDIESKGGWTMQSPSIKNLRMGDDSPEVRALKQQLTQMGDLAKNDNTTLFDASLEAAVRNFQLRHGLDTSGVVNDKTIEALNVPVKQRISDLLLNMERYRWMPEHLEGDNLIVNVPEYMLHVYHDEKEQWRCNVVVGSDSNNTVIFNDVMEYIVFSPYWNIPNSIIEKETAPAVLKNKHYLESHNMEIVDKQGNPVDVEDVDFENVAESFPYDIRQKPGGNNALGRVKFLLPNSHSIYLHDTPAKSLFKEDERAFSHGCIRVSEPVKLAKHLLRNDEKWTDEEIQEAMNKEEEKTVKLSQKVPVYIAYFTAWVDEAGRLNFREDIYGHNATLKKLVHL